MKKRILVLLMALAMTAAIAVPASAAQVGDVVNQYLYTDIKAYIDEAPIRSYNIDGWTAVVAEDLRDYGFNVVWDGAERTLSISHKGGDISASYSHAANTGVIGAPAGNVLYTDIKTYVEGALVTSYNIGGQTCIITEALRPFCAGYDYSNASRVLSLTTRAQVASVDLSQASATLTAGQELKLTATVAPASVSDKTVTWTSSSPSVASVSDSGVVVALKAGKTAVSAVAANGKSAACIVVVKEREQTSTQPSTPGADTEVKALTLSLSTSSVTVEAGQSVTSVLATLYPESGEMIYWKTSNKAVVKVGARNGKIVGVAEGTATITAYTESGLSASCTAVVTPSSNPVVTPPAEEETPATNANISLSRKTAALAIGKTLELKATVADTVAFKNVIWMSGDTSIATVANGVVTGVKAGTVTISAMLTNGDSASCIVSVGTSDLALSSIQAVNVTLDSKGTASTADDVVSFGYINAAAAGGSGAYTYSYELLLYTNKSSTSYTTVGSVSKTSSYFVSAADFGNISLPYTSPSMIYVVKVTVTDSLGATASAYSPLYPQTGATA